jgi:chromosome segregation ATPase
MQKRPYLPDANKQIKKRMTELGQYVSQIQADLQNIKLSGAQSSAVQSDLQDLNKQLADVSSRYQALQALVGTPTTKDVQQEIANQADAIGKIMNDACKLEDKLANELLGSSNVL